MNAFLFDEERFAGNRAHYSDFRNSLLNVVLGRRLGIPITLAVVYIEVARRAGLEVQGIAFPGHFLMRVPLGARDSDLPALVLDPFAGGAEMDEAACQRRLGTQLGQHERTNCRSTARCCGPARRGSCSRGCSTT